MSERENENSNEKLDDIIIDDDVKMTDDSTGDGIDEVLPEEIDVVEAILEEKADQENDEQENLTPEAEVEKWKEIAARNQADLENYRKRMARERTEAIQYANASLLSTLLPVIDNFEMGLKAAQNEGENSVIYQGMAMVRKQLDDFLVENRVEQIDATEGDAFDPNLHEAIQQEASDTIEEGKVLYTLRKGYKLKDRLLRPVNVVVSKGASDQEEGQSGENG